jgi:hypothetical protein
MPSDEEKARALHRGAEAMSAEERIARARAELQKIRNMPRTLGTLFVLAIGFGIMSWVAVVAIGLAIKLTKWVWS